MKKNIVLFLALLCGAIQMEGKVKLPAIISDNMVLQQKENVKLWGWAEPGETVEVSTSWGRTASEVADRQGKWALNIKASR